MSDPTEVLAELSRSNSELVSRLRWLARRRVVEGDETLGLEALGLEAPEVTVSAELRRHLEALRDAVRQVEQAAEVPRQSARVPTPRADRHLAVVPPPEAGQV